MKKKIIKIAQKAAIESFNKGRINPTMVTKFTNLFKKFPKYEAVVYLSEYAKALRRLEKQTILTIESSITLSSADKNKIIANIKKDYLISKVETKLNSTLLGGVKVSIGDMVYEDSLNFRIRQLGDVITNG